MKIYILLLNKNIIVFGIIINYLKKEYKNIYKIYYYQYNSDNKIKNYYKNGVES